MVQIQRQIAIAEEGFKTDQVRLGCLCERLGGEMLASLESSLCGRSLVRVNRTLECRLIHKLPKWSAGIALPS